VPDPAFEKDFGCFFSATCCWFFYRVCYWSQSTLCRCYRKGLNMFCQRAA